MRVLPRILSLTLLSISSSAFAFERGALEASLSAGYDLKHSRNELGDAPGLENRTEVPKSGPQVVLRGAYGVFDDVMVELEAGNTFSKMGKSGAGAQILQLRAFASYEFAHFGRLSPFARVGFGTEWLQTSSTLVGNQHDGDAVTLLGLGTRYELADQWALRFDAVGLVVPLRNNEQGVELEATVGVAFRFGGSAPRASTAAVVPTTNLAGGATPTAKGADADGDGVADASDKCPSAAEDRDGFQDDDGCPDPDNDGDGIADAQDKCIDKAETKNGFEDTDGCPDELPDADKDGVPDASDKCPNKPETKNDYQDDDGCPDMLPKKLKSLAGVLQGIEFKTGSAKIVPKTLKVLRKALAVLKKFKDVEVEVGGHTDNVGDAKKNQRLSQARADTVKAFLVKKGIKADRIRTVGYGADKPVDDNGTAEGRARNRRIVFRIL